MSNPAISQAIHKSSSSQLTDDFHCDALGPGSGTIYVSKMYNFNDGIISIRENQYTTSL